VKTGVVEKVMKRFESTPIGGFFDDARRDRCPREFVIHAHSEPGTRSGFEDLGEIGFERQVPAFMFNDKCVVNPNCRSVSRCIEAQQHSLICPTERDDNCSLIPNVADMVTEIILCEHVVKARRNWQQDRIRQGGGPPVFCMTNAERVVRERPQSVETTGVSCCGVLGTKHAQVFPAEEVLCRN